MKTTLTSSNEDYLERIAELIKNKGYARVSDIAEELNISKPSVTKMLQKLEKLGYVIRENYRGIALTEKGTKVGYTIAKRHTILRSFLSHLHISPVIIEKDIEGLEHHLSEETVKAIEKLVQKLG
jgi:Mn-dependent DtxR family transcriptional regulator